MNTLEHLLKKHNLHTDYIEIPNVGRDELVVLCRELGFRFGVEVGVAAGEYSEQLIKGHQWVRFWGIDPYVKYEGYKDYQLRKTFERMENEARQRVAGHPEYQLAKEFSVTAAKNFKDGVLDFVYIDGNHNGEAVRQDIEAWYPKVRSGGIIAGHDFTGRWPSLRKEVIAYCREKGIQLFILGMERKDLGLYRDTSRSWLFVKN